MEHMSIPRSKGHQPPPEALTRKQAHFFERLLEYRRREGVSPTVRELQELCGFKSPRSVLQFLDSLEAAGCIERRDGARNIRVLRAPDHEFSSDRTATVRVPLVGRVAAGLPVLAEQNVEDYLLVSRQLARPPHSYFLLRVVGDSMDRAGIANGDLVLVRRQATASPGEHVVALIDDEATVKRFHPTDTAVILEPVSSNPANKPIVLDHDFQIQGVVVRSLPLPTTSSNGRNSQTTRR